VLSCDDEQIAAIDHCLAQYSCLVREHDAIGDIIGQRVDPCRRLSDRETGRHGDRWQDPLEALAGNAFIAEWQLGADNGIAGMNLNPNMRGDQADDAFHFG
jgi:hypothetical protein